MALTAVALSFAAFYGSALAQPSDGGGHRKPPPEALAACKGLSSGQACTFSGPRGSVTGSCFTPQLDKPSACRPKDGPVHPDGPTAKPKP